MLYLIKARKDHTWYCPELTVLELDDLSSSMVSHQLKLIWKNGRYIILLKNTIWKINHTSKSNTYINIKVREIVVCLCLVMVSQVFKNQHWSYNAWCVSTQNLGICFHDLSVNRYTVSVNRCSAESWTVQFWLTIPSIRKPIAFWLKQHACKTNNALLQLKHALVWFQKKSQFGARITEGVSSLLWL